MIVDSPGSCVEMGFSHMTYDECKFVMSKRPERKQWKEKNAGSYYPSNCMQNQNNQMGWGQSRSVSSKHVGPDQTNRRIYNWVNVCKVSSKKGNSTLSYRNSNFC